jgi:exosortase C (VPDSG-CTERM-specific)
LQSTLYTHILLIPFIGLYLVFQRRPPLPGASKPNRKLAIALLSAGAVPLIGLGLAVYAGSTLALEDSLSLTTFSFLGFFAGICAFLLGREVFRSVLFPLTFLLFMVPLPVFLVEWIEKFLQHGSASVAHALFTLAGTTVFVDGLIFQLPNITIQVAPECSGIHSSLALFITSIIAGYVFLRSPGKRTILALAVIPLALLRNGLRVFVIGELCVRVGPEMINSYIHRHGGPLFFVLSLIPFFLLLFMLVKSEGKSRPGANPSAQPLLHGVNSKTTG